MSRKQKLELTWIGKDEEPRLEPRILIEDPDRSYGDLAAGQAGQAGENTQNMLLNRCEFGKKDYKLNIIDLPQELSD